MQRVTPWNVTSLRDAIINGPDIHPGATHYVDRLSTVRLLPNRKSRISASRKLPSSRGVVTQSGKGFNYEYEGKVVHRHLRNGDIVLVNRQVKQEKPHCYRLALDIVFMHVLSRHALWHIRRLDYTRTAISILIKFYYVFFLLLHASNYFCNYLLKHISLCFTWLKVNMFMEVLKLP